MCFKAQNHPRFTPASPPGRSSGFVLHSKSDCKLTEKGGCKVSRELSKGLIRLYARQFFNNLLVCMLHQPYHETLNETTRINCWSNNPGHWKQSQFSKQKYLGTVSKKLNLRIVGYEMFRTRQHCLCLQWFSNGCNEQLFDLLLSPFSKFFKIIRT